MKIIGKFDEYDVYKYDDLNCYIHYKESDRIYTIIDNKMVEVSTYLKNKLLGEVRE
ncbi:hypothetical protein D3C76_454960 [compost metagenome]